MTKFAAELGAFGQMEGDIFLEILSDLKREGWKEQADNLETKMRARTDRWRKEAYPFGSEMPWDSTGQEEVYAWTKYFGYQDKAEVTLNAILGYDPAIPHWGYNGSARRYWDFIFARQGPAIGAPTASLWFRAQCHPSADRISRTSRRFLSFASRLRWNVGAL